MREVDLPALNETELQSVKDAYETLSALTTPIKVSGLDEATACIMKMFSMFNFGVSYKQEIFMAKVDGWVENLENYLLYAIKVACKWAINGNKKEPSFAEFRDDVKFAMGSDVVKSMKWVKEIIKENESEYQYNCNR